MDSLGVHEHWNNAVDKQYSRNLGAGRGIELIRLSSRATQGDVDSDGVVDAQDLAALCEGWLQPSRLGADLNEDGTVDLHDFAILGRGWRALATRRLFR